MLLEPSRKVCYLLLWAAGGSVFSSDDEALQAISAQLEASAFGELRAELCFTSHAEELAILLLFCFIFKKDTCCFKIFVRLFPVSY